MINIKLPGSLKAKKILLCILVIIAIGVIVKNTIDNKQNAELNDTENQKNEDIITSDVNGNNGEVISETNKNTDDETITNKVAEKKDDSLAETELETREENLYSKAYETFHSGAYEKAIQESEDIILEYPNSYKGYNLRGIAKAYNGNFDDGMKDIDKALQIKPDYGYAIFNKALNFELNGYYDEAIKWYDDALKVEQYLWSYYGKASIYGRQGNISNSVDNLNKALALAKDSEEKKAIQKEARNESDFDPIKNTKEFQEVINN